MSKKFLLLICSLCFSFAAQAASPVLLVLGDSLSAGYGLAASQGWVSLLQQRLKTQGADYRVVNASVSGDTTAGGLSRLPNALQTHRPSLVLIELGGNDGLRGLPIRQLQQNLEKLIALTRASGATPVLLEMRIPSNYGPAYTESFSRAFGSAAAKGGATLVPFFLAPIAADAGNFQDDGIHPNAASQPRMLDAVWPSLQPLLSAPAKTTKPPRMAGASP